MPRTVLIAAIPVSSADLEVQVEVTLPVGRRPGKTHEKPGSVSRVGGPPKIPRIARLMALAIKLQDMVDRGEVSDYADVARLGFVTRARLTQIMNLTLLAPQIQEALLKDGGKLGGSLKEHDLRMITTMPLWEKQIEYFGRLLRSKEEPNRIETRRM